MTPPLMQDATAADLSLRAVGLPPVSKAEDGQELGREHWEPFRALSDGLQVLHAMEPPRRRRGYSWSRSLSFARVLLGCKGENVRHGSFEKPLVIWVLGATDGVEACLAEEGFFRDANWMDRSPTEVVIFGDGLRRVCVEASTAVEAWGLGDPISQFAQDDQLPEVRTAGYEALRWLSISSEPDFAAVLMPEVCEPGKPPCFSRAIPEFALKAVANVPVVVTTRLDPGSHKIRKALSQSTQKEVFGPTRVPFSSAAGRPGVVYDDNGWVFAVRGPGALDAVLRLELQPQYPLPISEDGARVPALFWGIVDLKYNTDEPLLGRVQFLETGDGTISKFSNDGKDIQTRYKDRFKQDVNASLKKYQVVSGDKKLAHDLMEQQGYGHVMPDQLCFPRRYEYDLAERIVSKLGVKDEDCVVLKLCNRSRAAGVVIVPVDELDEVLDELLVHPESPRDWLDEQVQKLNKGEWVLGLRRDSFEEQIRHWWSNESPYFVVERMCTSTPTEKEGQHFDGTMRVSFALRRKTKPGNTTATNINQLFRLAQDLPMPQQIPHPEDLEVDWLGGYWKLPKTSIEASDDRLRDRVISEAKLSGTAPVRHTHLFEVYAALGDSMQQLFGGLPPTPKELEERYAEQHEIAAFLTARLAVQNRKQNPTLARDMLAEADAMMHKVSDAKGKDCLGSYLARLQGIMASRGSDAAKNNQKTAEVHYQRSLSLEPMNANSLNLLGVSVLEQGRNDEAVDLLNGSLLLDPDHKAAYLNLSIGYLRAAQYKRVIEVSESCFERFPNTVQCNYHMAIACCQLALEAAGRRQEGEYEGWRSRSLDMWEESRAHQQNRKPLPACKPEPPWMPVDDEMNEAMREKGPAGMGRNELKQITLPPDIGWKLPGLKV